MTTRPGVTGPVWDSQKEDSEMSQHHPDQTSAADAQSEQAGGGLPLEGILIADFSRVLAGPYATMLLGDLGAEVIKVENAGGDDTRTWVPPRRPDGVSTYYAAINRNKKSIVLDFKDAEDLAAAGRSRSAPTW